MKKSIWVAAVVAVLCGNVALANVPAQDKPVSKTTTTVQKSSPSKAKASMTTKSVHTKHVKKAS